MPRMIGRYEVVGLLGEGGIGQVYAARDPRLGRAVAIKALRAEYSTDQSFLERFHAEAASLAGLSHPNITTLYDLLPEGDRLYMVMELVRGHTLESALTRSRRLGLQEALAVTAQAAAGLGYAHRMDVIHRDVKPSNLMLTESGLLKIMDFGIARVRGSQRLTRVGSIVGTLAYVAPEQIMGSEGDERSDLYSLACVFYEMLAGDPPFNADTEYELIRAQVDALPAPLASHLTDVPVSVDRAIQKALAKNPAERFASVEEFARTIGAEAIAGHAADIIRERVLVLAGPVPGQPAQSMAAADVSPQVNARRLPSGPSSVSKSSTTIPRAHPSEHGPRPNRAAFAVLGGVGAIVVVALGYLLVDASITPSSQPPPPVAAPISRGGAKEAIAPPKGSRMASIPPSGMILKDEGDGSAASPGPSPPPAARRSPPVSIASTQVGREGRTEAFLAQPNGDPAYQGRVSNWVAADMLFVPKTGTFGFRPLRLFGITDRSANKQQAERDRAVLNAFIVSAGNAVKCFAMAGHTFQCFVGNQDIALWAVRKGLARAADNAPRQYREANP